jgi:hypothetical protein
VRRTPEREVPAGPEELVRLAVLDRGVEPVPRGRGVDEIEGMGLARPGLERRDVNLERQPGEVAPRLRGQVRAQLDAGD